MFRAFHRKKRIDAFCIVTHELAGIGIDDHHGRRVVVGFHDRSAVGIYEGGEGGVFFQERLIGQAFVDDDLQHAHGERGIGGGFDRNPFRGLCLLYTSPSPRDISGSRMPSSA